MKKLELVVCLSVTALWGSQAIAGDSSRAILRDIMQQRVSVRSYTDTAIPQQVLSDILFAGQGVTRADQGLRTVASATALYPLTLYVIAHHVDGLPAGLYRYEVETGKLVFVAGAAVRDGIIAAAYEQECIQQAAAIIALCADYSRMRENHGDHADRYVHIEAGACAQNMNLQALTACLGAVFVGWFDDAAVKKALALPVTVEPVMLLPLGFPQK